MKAKIIALLVIIAINVSQNFIHAQDIALTTEVYQSNGIYYKNSGSAFSGTLYEYNEAIANDCSCTLQAEFSNGILNGLKKQWHNNSNLKFIGSFINGSPDNVHKSYSVSGNLFEELYYLNGNLSWNKNYYDSGNIKKLTTYNDTGEKEKSVLYFDGYNKPIKVEERYEKGKIISSKEYYLNNKTKALKKFSNGEITEETTYYENGNINSIYTYLKNEVNTFSSFTEDGKPIKKYKWLSGLDLHENHEYYPNGNLKRHYFKNKNGKLDSINTTYYQDGLKEREVAYFNSKLIREGSFRENKKQGDWFYYSKDGNTKTTNTFESDSLVNTKLINYSHLVKNISFESYDALYIYKEYDSDKQGLIKFSFINNFSSNSSNNRKIASKIKSQLQNNLILAYNRSIYNEQSIVGYIVVEGLDVKYKSSIYERGGKKETGYDAFITFKLSIYNADKEQVHVMQFKENKSDKLLTSLLKNATSTFLRTEQSAFENSLKHLNISEFLYRYFPIQGLIEKVTDENSKKIKEVQLNIGLTEKVYSGMKFKVVNPENNNIAKLKVEKFLNNKAIAEVLEGEKELKTYMLSNKKVKVIQIKK